MLKFIVLLYLVFEVSSKRKESPSNIVASTKSNSKFNPQAYKETAKLIYLINRQSSDEEKENLENNGESKNVKVDNTGYDESKTSVLNLLQLIQKNYDAKLKYGDQDVGDDVRIHIISNPEVLENYKKKLFESRANSASVDNRNLGKTSHSPKKIYYEKTGSMRKKAAFHFDSLSRENRHNSNQNEEKSLIHNKKNIGESIKDNSNENNGKSIEDRFNDKGNQNWGEDTKSNRGKFNKRKDKSSEGYRSGGSKDTWSKKGSWENHNIREKDKQKKDQDYNTPKKNTRNDDYRWDQKAKKNKDKDDWGQTRKSKNSKWNDIDTTQNDNNISWQKEDISTKNNKENDWGHVGKQNKWDDETKTTKKHMDYDRKGKDMNVKWSAEILDDNKSKKKNTNSRSAKHIVHKSVENSWENENKKKTNRDDSWNNWTEKKPYREKKVRKSERDSYIPRHDTYKSKKSKDIDFGRSAYGRTPIPFVGKKGIYDD